MLGPLAGGLITQHLSWAWIFWINVPVGVLASAGFVAFLHEDVAHSARRVDVPGAVLFAAAVASLMVALTEIGTSGRTVLVAAMICAASTVLFVLQERRAKDPMVAFSLWALRPIATANAATLLSGMAIIGLTAFLPMYVQGVLGHSALVAGFTLTAMSLGWPIGATIAARNFARVGLRACFLCGAALLPVGGMIMLTLQPGMSPAVAGVGSLIIGLGMGFLSTSAIVIIQGSVGWAERGAATASNVFSRNLGSTFGATLLGGVLNTSLANRIAGGDAAGFDQIRRLLERPGRSLEDAAVRLALGQSLHNAFWAMFLLTVSVLLVAVLVPSVSLKQAAERPAE